MGKRQKQWETLFLGAPKSLWMVTAAMKLKDTYSLESYDKPREYIKQQSHYFANKGPYSHSYGLSSSHVRMGELNHDEDWSSTKELTSFEWLCWTRFFRVPWTARSQLVGKGYDAGKDWKQREKGVQRMRCLDSITNSMDTNVSKLQETVKAREACHAADHGAVKSWTQAGHRILHTRFKFLNVIY